MGVNVDELSILAENHGNLSPQWAACAKTSMIGVEDKALPVVPYKAAEISKTGPIVSIGGFLCDSWMAERTHWWTERWLRLWVSPSLPLPLPLALSLSLCVPIPLSLSLYIYPPLFFYLSTYLPIYLPTYLSVYLSIYLPIYLSICLIYLSIYLSLDLSIYLPTYLIYLPIYLFTYLPTTVYINSHLFTSSYIYLLVSTSIYICLSIFLSTWEEVIMRDFLQKRKLAGPKWRNAARRPQITKNHRSKTTNSARFPQKIEVDNIRNEAIPGGFLQ